MPLLLVTETPDLTRSFIDHYRLTRVRRPGRLVLYAAGGPVPVILAECGPGVAMMAAATAFLIGTVGSGILDQNGVAEPAGTRAAPGAVVACACVAAYSGHANAGASDDGRGTYLCAACTNVATGRSSYPDIRVRHSFPEATVATFSRIAGRDADLFGAPATVLASSGEEAASRLIAELHDRSLAGFFEAGGLFLAPQRLQAFAVVAGREAEAGNGAQHGGGPPGAGAVDAASIAAYLEVELRSAGREQSRNAEATTGAISPDASGAVSRNVVGTTAGCTPARSGQAPFLEKLREKLRLTETQFHEARRLLQEYAAARGGMPNDGMLDDFPRPDTRQEAKRLYRRFVERLEAELAGGFETK